MSFREAARYPFPYCTPGTTQVPLSFLTSKLLMTSYWREYLLLQGLYIPVPSEQHHQLCGWFCHILSAGLHGIWTGSGHLHGGWVRYRKLKSEPVLRHCMHTVISSAMHFPHRSWAGIHCVPSSSCHDALAPAMGYLLLCHDHLAGLGQSGETLLGHQ